MKYQVLVRLKPGVLDVQGKAVQRGLGQLGITEVTDVRIGRLVELEVEADSDSSALERVEQVCRELLANPIIERYEVKPID